MRIGIVGLGLIGGSLAKALSSRTDHEIVGLDIDPEVMLQARQDGAISAQTGMEECDVVFVCLHPYAAVAWMRSAELPEGMIVADTCGVKRFVRDNAGSALEVRGIRYVGTHPMAGREIGGYGASHEDLFDGASWILTTDDNTDRDAMAVIEEIVRTAGAAEVPVTSAEDHDRIIAYTSQMAHVVSNAYVKNEAALEERGFTGGSFQDLTRVAQLDPAMWTELFLTNADDLVRNLDEFMDNLRVLRDCIYNGDGEKLSAQLAEGSERRISISEMERAIERAQRKK